MDSYNSKKKYSSLKCGNGGTTTSSNNSFAMKKPKRPLSGYNLFFMVERLRILKQHEQQCPKMLHMNNNNNNNNHCKKKETNTTIATNEGYSTATTIIVDGNNGKNCHPPPYSVQEITDAIAASGKKSTLINNTSVSIIFADNGIGHNNDDYDENAGITAINDYSNTRSSSNHCSATTGSTTSSGAGGYGELAWRIGERWRNLHRTERKVFEDYAKDEKYIFDYRMKQYKKHLKNIANDDNKNNTTACTAASAGAANKQQQQKEEQDNYNQQMDKKRQRNDGSVQENNEPGQQQFKLVLYQQQQQQQLLSWMQQFQQEYNHDNHDLFNIYNFHGQQQQFNNNNNIISNITNNQLLQLLRTDGSLRELQPQQQQQQQGVWMQHGPNYYQQQNNSHTKEQLIQSLLSELSAERNTGFDAATTIHLPADSIYSSNAVHDSIYKEQHGKEQIKCDHNNQTIEDQMQLKHQQQKQRQRQQPPPLSSSSSSLKDTCSGQPETAMSNTLRFLHPTEEINEQPKLPIIINNNDSNDASQSSRVVGAKSTCTGGFVGRQLLPQGLVPEAAIPVVSDSTSTDNNILFQQLLLQEMQRRVQEEMFFIASGSNHNINPFTNNNDTINQSTFPMIVLQKEPERRGSWMNHHLSYNNNNNMNKNNSIHTNNASSAMTAATIDDNNYNICSTGSTMNTIVTAPPEQTTPYSRFGNLKGKKEKKKKKKIYVYETDEV